MANKLILSDTWANDLLARLGGKATSLSIPTQIWIGLSSNDPVADKNFSEIPANETTNYARTLVSIKGEAYPDLLSAVSGRSLASAKQIVFNKAAGAYTANGIGLFSAEKGGTPYAWGKLNSTLNVVAGSLPMFEPGDFALEIPDGTEAG